MININVAWLLHCDVNMPFLVAYAKKRREIATRKGIFAVVLLPLPAKKTSFFQQLLLNRAAQNTLKMSRIVNQTVYQIKCKSKFTTNAQTKS